MTAMRRASDFEDAVEVIDLEDGKKIVIEYDDDPINPRKEWDHFGTIVCLGQGGDWPHYADIPDPRKEIPPGWTYDEDKDLFQLPKKCAVLNVYIYDHSGVALSTGSGGQFSDPWDSGKLGVIYATAEKIRENFMVKQLRKKHYDKALEVLEGEIKEYNSYLSGECYGYIILDANGEEIDSCWGFLGDREYCIAEAKAAAGESNDA